ncbi:MAG: peptidase S41 [Planctomycetes bacterium]|nr:peptidase S41 [Planctomycetota bacterium]
MNCIIPMGLVVMMALSGTLTGLAAEHRPLLRFPDVHEDTVVFVHGEDIWKASTRGGLAQRLTIHDGQERFPKFSPDGEQIAFTGAYDGNSDVYVMSVHGGAITRVTYHPGADTMVGWHPHSGKILFRSARAAYSRFERLYLISPDGSGLEELMMHEAVAGSFSGDGSLIAYNRIARETRTWKRYQGGTAQDLWLFDMKTHKDRRLTEFTGTDRIPMWVGDRIFFSSDRERVLNIFALDPGTGRVQQMTRHQAYDVRRPSVGGSQIVYELGAQLWLLDVETGKTRAIEIEVKADAPERRPYLKDVSGDVTQITCSPSGKRALVVARGEVFTVPKKDGPTRNLTASSGSRQKDAVWSPDGRSIACLSDESGEYAIHLIDPLGKEETIQLTGHDQGYRHTLRWSPDSRKIAFADQSLRFFYVDVESTRITEVDRSATEPTDIGIDLKPINDYTWSPDSRYIAYSKIDEDLVSRIYIHALDTGQSTCVSGALFNDFGPVFTRDGKHLLFISNRRFDPTYCDFEWEMVYKRAAGLYALTLESKGDPLLPLLSDEEEIEEDDAEGEQEKVDEEADEDSDADQDAEDEECDTPKVTIDFEGIVARVEALPVGRGNYRRLSVNDDLLFFLDAESGDFNRFEYRAVNAVDLHAFSFKDRDTHMVMAGIRAYDLSSKGEHIAYQKGGSVGIIAASDKDAKGEALGLSGLKVQFDPPAEWQQIFDEAWRMERDFYYEPNMHGLDWTEVKAKYGRLVPFASCRQDLRFLIGEMIGELSTSHTYVYGGDHKRRGNTVNVGLLGADWEVDPDSDRYRVARVLRVPDWTQGVIPPLARPGVDVQEDDYLLAVNGRPVHTHQNLYSFFQGLVGKQVALLVNDRPSAEQAREVMVVPMASERTLRYRDWVERNRLTVERLSKGKIGYMHLPDTYGGSAREFPKYFYSQTQKQGLLIDGRYNGGGLDPDILLQRLGKRALSFWTRRYSMYQTSPPVVTHAHMALLTNRQAGSGGDMLPMQFQLRGMGPVIGTRTWGGLVGVSMFIRMIDGGGLTAPDYRIYDATGKWVVENKGIEPDITVDLDPAQMAEGHDAQLLEGIEVIMKQIEADPWTAPTHPAFPKGR